MKKIESIQTYRGISILLIMLCHYFEQCIFCGYIGVSAFLVMSGFLTVYVQKDKPIDELSITKKIVNRIKKKLKKYYSLFVFSTIISAPFCMLLIHDKLGIYKVLIHLLMLQAWIPNEEWLSVINGPSWYLSVDIFCTVLSIPLIVLCRKIHDKKILLRMLLADILIVFLLGFLHVDTPKESRWFWYFFPGTRWLDFVAGGILARIVQISEKEFKKVNSFILEMVALVFYFSGAIVAFLDGHNLEYAAVWLPASLLSVLTLVHNEKILYNKPFYFMGEISMELFLLHMPIMRYWVVMDNHLLHLKSDFVIAVCSFISAVIVSLFWRKIVICCKVRKTEEKY